MKITAIRPLVAWIGTRNQLLVKVETDEGLFGWGESGLSGFSAAIRYGLVAPAGTPRAIVDRLNKELQAALAADDLRARLVSEGAEPLPGTPKDYAAEIDREETKWGALVRQLNLRIE